MAIVTRRTYRLEDLPGTTREIVAVYSMSVTDSMELLKAGESVCAAGNAGALHVWVNDAGMFACVFSVHKKITESKEFKYVAAAAQWLKDWFPRLER